MFEILGEIRIPPERHGGISAHVEARQTAGDDL